MDAFTVRLEQAEAEQRQAVELLGEAGRRLEKTEQLDSQAIKKQCASFSRELTEMEAGFLCSLVSGLDADRLPGSLLTAELAAFDRHTLLEQDFEVRKARHAIEASCAEMTETLTSWDTDFRTHTDANHKRLQNLNDLADCLDQQVLDCSQTKKCMELLSSRQLAALECVEALQRYESELARLEQELGQEQESADRS